MTTIIAGFAFAAVLAWLLTFGVRHLAGKAGAVDNPDGGRKVHGRPVPTLGGTGVWLACFIPVLLVLLFPSRLRIGKNLLLDPAFTRVLLGLFAGGTVALALGLWDDISDLRPLRKLLLQVLAATAAYVGGARIEAIHFARLGLHFDLGLLSYPLSLFWFLGCMNAINLVDGLDGLASGLSLFVLLSMAVTGALFGNPEIAFLAACVAGASFGFLFHNFHPAKIFLGDSGSMFLGFSIAALSLSCSTLGPSTGVALLVPITALGLPIMDTLLAITRRWVRRMPLSSADKEHLHHTLMRMGLSHRNTVLFMWGVCLVFAAAALMLAISQHGETVVLILGSMIIVSLAFARIFGGVNLRHILLRVRGGFHQRNLDNESKVALGRIMNGLNKATTVDTIWDVLTDGFAGMKVDYARLHLEHDAIPHNSRCRAWRLVDLPHHQDGDLDLWEARYNITHNDCRLGTLVLGRHMDDRGHSSELMHLVSSLCQAVGHRLAMILGEVETTNEAYAVHLIPQNPTAPPHPRRLILVDSGDKGKAPSPSSGNR